MPELIKNCVMPSLDGDHKTDISFVSGLASTTGRGVVPCLHMSLTMLLSGRVVELKRSETRTSHKQEGDVLNFFDILFLDVL